MIEWHESGNNSALENLARHLARNRGSRRPLFCNVRCAKSEKPFHYFEYKLKFSRFHADKLNSKPLAWLKIASYGLQFYLTFLRREQQL